MQLKTFFSVRTAWLDDNIETLKQYSASSKIKKYTEVTDQKGAYMKKFIIIVLCIALLFVGVDAAYYRLGAYIDLNPSKEVKTFVKTAEKDIMNLK